MVFKTRPANPANYGGHRKQTRYIVIHYTANDGDTDENNGNYFANNSVGASAHFFVDSDSVTRSVPEDRIAWHCGAKAYRHPECRNSNSIGVEICDDERNGVIYPSQETIDNALKLTQLLMKKYHVPPERVIRHYDVTGKLCPAYWVDDKKWKTEFHDRLTEEEEEVRYTYLKDIPDKWGFRETIDKLMTAGIIGGDGSDPNGNGDKIDLSHDMVRLLMFEYRGGAFDRKLIKAGLEPAVKE